MKRSLFCQKSTKHEYSSLVIAFYDEYYGQNSSKEYRCECLHNSFLDERCPNLSIYQFQSNCSVYMLKWVCAYQLKQHVASEAFKTSTPKYPEKKKALEQQSNHTNSNNQTIEHSNNIGSNIQTPEHSNGIAPNRENLEPETLLRSSLLAILVFGMFAYPSEILSIKIVATTCVGLLASMAVPLLTCNEFSFLPRVKNPLYPLGLNLSLFTIVITAFFVVTPNVNKCFTAYCKWKDAIDLYNYGMYQQCLDDYKKAYPVLKYNGGYLLNYGKALSMAQKHDEAVTILEQAKSYQSNSVLYTALGDSYKALGNYQYAEQQYLQAANMAPAKFYPLYLLAKLYDVSGQQHKALEMANILLNKEVKVHSTAIDEIKEEMTQIIEQYTKGKQP